MIDQYLEEMESGFNAGYDDHAERYAASQLDSDYEAYCDSGCPSYEEWLAVK